VHEHVFWAISRIQIIVGLTFGGDREKNYTQSVNKFIVHFTIFARSNHWSDFRQIWHRNRYRRINHAKFLLIGRGVSINNDDYTGGGSDRNLPFPKRPNRYR